MKPEAASEEIAVRHCHSLAEFAACLEIQKRVWGGADMDVVPLPLFVVAAETGGQVLGAFLRAPQRTELVGFTLAVAAVRDARPFLHSHMTAVLEAYRDRGVGRKLKLFQRQDALERGMDLVEWTFDPLELKNACFNLMRLGAIARRYLSNCYGITSSPLHGGLPTDRLVAEWWLRSQRVEAASTCPAGAPPSASPRARSHESLVRIHVPATIGEMRQEDQAQARRVQDEMRKQFQRWFARGYAATGIEITPSGGDYLLEPWDQPGNCGAV